MTENGMVGCLHRLNGHEFEKTLGDSEEHGSRTCYSPWNSPGQNTGVGSLSFLQGIFPTH